MKNIYLTLVSAALLLPTYASAFSDPIPPPFTGSQQTTTSIPEPSIIALLGLGIAAIFLIKKFKK